MDSIEFPVQFRWWTKMGYGARRVIYLSIGGLAAIGNGGVTMDITGAIRTILDQPLGYALLLLVIGLSGYMVWHLIQAIRDTDGRGSSLKALAIRFALAVGAVTPAALAEWAVSMLAGWGDDQRSDSTGLLASDTGRIGA